MTRFLVMPAKSNSNSQYGDLSTALRFGRDDEYLGLNENTQQQVRGREVCYGLECDLSDVFWCGAGA